MPQGYFEIFQVGSGKGLRIFLAEEKMTTHHKGRPAKLCVDVSRRELSGPEEPHTSVPAPRGEAGLEF